MASREASTDAIHYVSVTMTPSDPPLLRGRPAHSPQRVPCSTPDTRPSTARNKPRRTPDSALPLRPGKNRREARYKAVLPQGEAELRVPASLVRSEWTRRICNKAHLAPPFPIPRVSLFLRLLLRGSRITAVGNPPRPSSSPNPDPSRVISYKPP